MVDVCGYAREAQRAQDLHGVDAHIGKEGVDLAADEFGRHRQDVGDGLRILRSEGGHHGTAVGAQGHHGFHVGQNAGPPGGVDAGDGQGVGDHGVGVLKSRYETARRLAGRCLPSIKHFGGGLHDV